jgi:CRP/FNR family cyclic AMP-dependent transcriptional regulator
MTQPDWPPGAFLGALSPRCRAELLALGVQQRLSDGAILIHEGGRDSHVVLLRRGLAKVTATTPEGRVALLAIRVPGDLVGEMSAVTACGPVRVTVIYQPDFQSFLKSHPEAAVQLAAMVADRLRYANQRRVDHAASSVRVRVARVLAEIASAHGQATAAGMELGVPLSQPELAGLCGAAEISVQKALRELRDEGLLSTGYRRITVLDLPALRNLT